MEKEIKIERLRRVLLREVWKDEAKNFTSWLFENIEILGEELDMDLTSIEKEGKAGSFSVDIVAEDGMGQKVVIENQLERTNHEHLGKIITYLSNLEAKIAIQINNERFLNEKEIFNFLKNCLKVLEKGNRTIKNFSREDWVRKIIEMRYLWLKPAKDLLGKNWQPSPKVYYLVGKINQAEKAGIKFGQKMRTLMAALSPKEVMKKLTQLFLNNISPIHF